MIDTNKINNESVTCRKSSEVKEILAEIEQRMEQLERISRRMQYGICHFVMWHQIKGNIKT